MNELLQAYRDLFGLLATIIAINICITVIIGLNVERMRNNPDFDLTLCVSWLSCAFFSALAGYVPLVVFGYFNAFVWWVGFKIDKLRKGNTNESNHGR